VGQKEEIIMLEFLVMMSVMAMVFCAATVIVSLISGVLLKTFQAFKQKKA